METENKSGVIAPWLLWTLIGIIVIAAGFFGWQYMSQKNATSTPVASSIITPTKSATSTPTVSASDVSTVDWKTYTNETYNLTFKYPPSYSVVEDAKTATIYITPDKNPACPTGEFCSGPKYFNQVSIDFARLADNEKGKDLENAIKQHNSDKKDYEYQISVSEIGQNNVAKVVYPCSAKVNGETINLGGIGCDQPFYQLTDSTNIISISPEGTVIDVNTFLSTFQFTP